MSNAPNPVNKTALSRASVIGGVLGALGIAGFLICWFLLGSAGLETMTRLLISICAPPAIIALGAGVYLLVIAPRNK
jgi:hypothetical protein